MSELKQMAFEDLIDLLNSQTSTYMKMLRAGATREQFHKLREQMREVQLEIETRKTVQKSSVTGISIPVISFTQDTASSSQVGNSN